MLDWSLSRLAALRPTSDNQDRIRQGLKDIEAIIEKKNFDIRQRDKRIAHLQKTAEARDAVLAAAETELATLRAENAHLKRALALADALRNKERNLPL